MERWNMAASKKIENEKVDAFLAEVWAVCEKHGLALSHEDAHGAFEVVNIDPGYRDWLMAAHDATRPQD